MDPDKDLVLWAVRLGVTHAQDRPWSYFPSDVDHPAEDRCPCPCRSTTHPAVTARRYSYDHGRIWVWLGQCPTCQAIVWSFAPQEGVR